MARRSGEVMEFRQLRTFCEIAETRSFTKAAQRVHVTQAAVSAQIKALETEAGTPLFSRINKKVFLTEAGELLLKRADRMLREHDEALYELSELGQLGRGRLRIGTASTMASNHPLPTILAELKRDHPLLQLTVLRGTSAEIVAKILANDLDLGLVSLPVEATDIRTEVLRRDRLVAIVPPNHRLAGQRTVSATQLAGEPLIMGEEGGNTRRLIDLFFEKAGLKPEVIMKLGSTIAINRMVECGLGVSIVPRSSAEHEIAEGQLCALTVRNLNVYYELGLAALKEDHMPPIQRRFRELCQRYFES
ncbi:MAG: LysR family transcriptional regulator [Acidobacteriota bacterium]